MGADSEVMRERKWNERDREKEKEHNLCLVAAGRVIGEWHFSVWLAYGANSGSSTAKERSGESEEEWLALTASTQERRGWWSWRMTRMSVSGQASHLSRGNRPSHTHTPASSCGESGGRSVITSHYEMEAIWTTLPATNCSPHVCRQ